MVAILASPRDGNNPRRVRWHVQSRGFTAGCGILMISPTRNMSVSSARRWMDAFRLSIN